MSLKSKIVNFGENVKSLFTPKAETEQINNRADMGLLKAFISNEFLYKPPYGYPRMVDVPTLRALAKTPYVFMVVSTIVDEVASVEWDIVPKEKDEPKGSVETSDDIKLEDERKKRAEEQQLKKIQDIKEFFNNPNGNEESFEFLLRAVVRDILELDSGVLVKVFNQMGKLKQVFARDGGTFLKNPDIHGYLGDREDFTTFYPSMKLSQNNKLANTFYDLHYKEKAAYFQYGWVAMMPIPFGKKEVIYMMKNARSDSIYGRSPVEILNDVILTLFYGSKYNLDFYTNNNMPEGILQLIGANKEQIKAFRERFEKQFKKTDKWGNVRKIFHKVPISNTEAKFTPFQLKPEEMQIISQQEWFTKIVWACFGITPSELGFTENSNRATEISQSKVFKRKAVKPLLRLLEYYINTQLMPDLDDSGDFEFRFIEYDLQEDIEKHKLYEIQLKNGIKNVNEIREDLGLNPIEGGENYKDPQENPFDQFNPNFKEDEEDEIREQMDFAPKSKKALDTEETLTLKENEKPKKKIKKTLLTYLREREKEILKEIEDIYKSDKLSEIKSSLWERLIKKLEGIFKNKNIKPLVEEFTKNAYKKGMESSEIEFAQNFFPNQQAVDFLKDYNFDLVKNMNEETANKLKSALQRGFMNNVPMAEIKKDVRKIFDTTENRAEKIVRTETNRAENFGRLDGAQQSGIVKGKSLVGIKDERTSPICTRMLKKYENKTIPLDDKFKDSKTGESFMAPPFHVNCFVDGTKIITDKGNKNIEDIQTGDYVLTGKNRYMEVTETMNRIINEDIYVIKTKKGNIEVTGNHPIMTSKGWKKAKELKRDDWVLYAK